MKIALYGKSGTGKTTIAEYLQRKHHFVVCQVGERCRQLAREFFNTEAKSVLNQIALAFHTIQPGILLRRALTNIPETVSHLVIDSIRFPEDYDYVKKNGFTVWRVNCPLEVRLQRLAIRHQQFDSATDEANITETALDNAKALIITNNQGLEDLFRTIDILLSPQPHSQ